MSISLYRAPWLDRLWWVLVFGLALSPFLFIVYGVLGNTLGPDPAEVLMYQTGEWAIRLLVLVLTARPLARWGWPALFRYRRMLGLFAFFYILLHFVVYAVLDQSLDLAAIIEVVIKRPYITLGMAGLLMLIPLAVTSTRGMMRRLGKRWQKLHRLVYVIAIVSVWHFYWQVKLDTLDASIYAVILAVLLGTRSYFSRISRPGQRLNNG